MAASAAIALSSPSSSSSPGRTPHIHTGDDDDEDSDAASDAGSPSGSDPENLFSATAVRPKSLKLPEWARGGIARYSGADLERMKRGAGKNRKRKRLDVDSSDNDNDDDDNDDQDGDDVSDGRGGKGKGKAALAPTANRTTNRTTGLGAFDGLGGSMWEKQLAATKAAAGVAAAARARGAHGRPGDRAEFSADSDDSLEAEFAVYEQPEPEPVVRRRSPWAARSRSRSTAATASASASASPVRRASSIKVVPPVARGGAGVRSPRKYLEAQRVAGVLVVTSGDEEDEAMQSVGGGAGGRDDTDEDGEGYMPNIERIRSMMGRSGSASSEQHQYRRRRSPPVPPIPGAFPASTAGSSATADQSLVAYEEEEEAQQQIAIKLKMVFDPTRNAPEVAKRAYERLETFSIGLVSFRVMREPPFSRRVTAWVRLTLPVGRLAPRTNPSLHSFTNSQCGEPSPATIWSLPIAATCTSRRR